MKNTGNKSKINRRKILAYGGATIASMSMAPRLSFGATATLADTMVFMCHSTGSGNIIATVLSDALQKKNATRIRVTPASNGVGLVLPLKTGRADYTFAANELFFAAEAGYEFGTREWGGPQDLRLVLAPPKALGMASAKDANIFKPADLKGKRLGYVKGSPSVNVKMDAYLAFAGLSRGDVEVVWLSNSARGSKDALINNQVDAVTYTTNSPAMKEVEMSPRGLRWVEFDPQDKAGWARLQAIMPAITPRHDTEGEAMSVNNPVNIMGWKYPQVACYASRDPDQVYAFIKALDESYSIYKDAHPDMKNLNITLAGKTPADVPFHDGAIRYLKEKKIWTAADEEWQEKRIARIKTVENAWSKATKEFPSWMQSQKAQGKATDEAEAWGDFWEMYRAQKI